MVLTGDELTRAKPRERAGLLALLSLVSIIDAFYNNGSSREEQPSGQSAIGTILGSLAQGKGLDQDMLRLVLSLFSAFSAGKRHENKSDQGESPTQNSQEEGPTNPDQEGKGASLDPAIMSLFLNLLSGLDFSKLSAKNSSEQVAETREKPEKREIIGISEDGRMVLLPQRTRPRATAHKPGSAIRPGWAAVDK